MDKASGKDLHRPQFEQLTAYVREGDTVICHSMDRLARNLDDLRKVVLGFIERGIHVRFEKENLTDDVVRIEGPVDRFQLAALARSVDLNVLHTVRNGQ